MNSNIRNIRFSPNLNEIENWYKCPASADLPVVCLGGLATLEKGYTELLTSSRSDNTGVQEASYTELLTSSRSDNTGVQVAGYNSTILNNDN